jgi:DNA topoisomerase-2
MPEYMEWRKEAAAPLHVTAGDRDGEVDSDIDTALKASTEKLNRKYSIKYYKGLGTNTSAEGKEYFRALSQHKKFFYSEDAVDDSIDLAFNKNRVTDRRTWMRTKFDPEAYIDPTQERVSYEEFVNKELIQFSVSNNHR